MKKSVIVSFFSIVFLTACGGGGGGDYVNDQQKVADGKQISYAIQQPGTYTANITASNNGITVAWPGSSDCRTTSSETKLYKNSCTFPSTGQLVITNPTTLFGIGGDEIVTVTVVRN
jgi:hypothetical protein